MQQRFRPFPCTLEMLAVLVFGINTTLASDNLACLATTSAINTAWLEQSKQAVSAGDRYREAAMLALVEQADRVFTRKPATIKDKAVLPPSADRQDYMSLSPYWWPDPQREDGLPWIRRDGKVNPLAYAKESDKARLRSVADNLEVLAIASYLTGDLRYARKAAQILDVWFVDPTTRMNPHLKYAQSIPGRTDGRSFGIIDALLLIRIIDSLDVINCTDVLSKTQSRKIRQWYQQMLEWLRTSTMGVEERDARNNHGTHYDSITLSMALYLNDTKLARKIIERTKRRMVVQITSDGAQPHELQRTRPFHYSLFNLEAFFRIATQAEHLDIDLWRYPSKDDARLQKALHYLIERRDSDQWRGGEETTLKVSYLDSFLRRAALVYAPTTVAGKLVATEQPARALNCALLHPPSTDAVRKKQASVPEKINYQRCAY